MRENITNETLALMKTALNSGSVDLLKAITTATGLNYFDLMGPAKNLYPTITMLRNTTRRVSRPAGYGLSPNWKVILGLTGSGFDSMGWVPEGGRSGTMSYSAVDKSAPYVTIGEEDNYTFEAEGAAEGFEDIQATSTMRLLQKTMRKEEGGLLAGNRTLALGTPANPSLSARSDAASTLPSLTYSVIVVALSMEGYLNCKGSAAVGFTPSKTITGADGNQYTLNGGNSNKSAAITQATVSGTSGLACTVTPIKGAVAYAWFVGGVGAETLQSITTINSAYFSAPLAAGRQAATTVTADNSLNATMAFDGFLTNAFANGSVTMLANGVAGVGTALTASGHGSITEIDNFLQNMWDANRAGPTKIYVSSQEQRNITAKVLSNTSGPLLRYDVGANDGKPYAITAGGSVRYYYNPFVGEGGQNIPVVAHPDLAPGTIYFHTEDLPEWYQSNETPTVAEVITRREYHRIDWPLRTRKREFGVYAEETLACYAPFLLGALTNIANG